MDTVRIFNQELSGLYESKPPISKAKMASITRSAMKAIKFYKHVVQSVEKFISKCKSEYKIPGLYVIDSIVRQSRHQFGTEKDVFAPRFARNMEQTFAHLFRCPPEDKSKIIRVLNLWQKNMVFAPETIQPLFDLANPEHPLHLQYNASLAAGGGGADQSGAGSNGAGGLNTSSMSHDSPGPMSHDDHHSSGGGGGSTTQATDPSKVLDPNTIRQLQQFQQILMRQTSGSASETGGKNQVKFDKKLLAADFDYGSEDEEDKNSPSVPSTTLPDGGNIAAILSDPNVLKQLQQLQNLQKLKQHEMEEKQSKLTEMRLQEEKFEKHLASVLKKLPFANECDLSRQPAIDLNAGLSSSKDGDGDDFGMVTEVISDTHSSSPRSLPPDTAYKSSSSSRRRKSRSRSPRDRGGRSDRDRDRGGRSRRSRSRSRSRSHSPRRGGGTSGRSGGRDRDRARNDKDKERDKERERERKKRGLPEIRKEHLSVCSTTLWVGHLSKLVQQEELSDTFGKYGDIVSIDLIPPRGCAFIVMNRRQDAYKSMQSLKNHKMHGRTITISWATGKGVKSKEWKDYWDIDLGCSYIPWSKINHATDLEALEEGGMFDEETMPQWLKDKIANKGAAASASDPAVAAAAGAAGTTPASAAAGLINPLYPLDTSQPPPPASTMMAAAAAGMAGLAGFPLGARLPMMGLPLMAGLGMNVPPPNLMMAAGAAGLSANPPPLPMGAAGFGALPPPPPSSNVVNLVSGDEMDIEMEDENSNSNPLQPPPDPAAFFNQPPPPLMPPDFNRNNPMAGQPGGDFNSMGGDNERGGRGNRGNDFDRRGGRGDRGGRRDFDRDNGNSRDGVGGGGRGRRNFRDGSGDRNEPRQSRWGSNDRNRGGEGGRDDRPLSERLRELAGADFSQRNDDGGPQPQGPPFGGGGRNFRGGRNMNNEGGDDFNNRGGDDFGGRRGNFQNQGGRFQNQRGGRFNNRGGGGGGFNRQQQRGGPDGDMQGGPMNIMSLLNMFGGNEDMQGNMDGGGGNMDPDMMQDQQFFDGGNNNFGNRRGNNWNDRGNRGGRGGGGNWRDNNDGGDGSDGGGGRGRFGRRGDRGRRSDFGGGFGGGDDQPPQQHGRGGGGQGGPRWDENDETWDDLPAAKPRGDNRPPRDEPAQEQQQPQRHHPQEEPVRDSQETGILGGGDEWECDAPKRIAPNFSEPSRQHEEPDFGGGRGDSHGDDSNKQQDRHEGSGGGNGTPLFDESAPAPAAAAVPEMFHHPSPPARDPEPEPQPQKFSPEPNRPQLYSPSPPPQQQQHQAAPEVFEERNFAQEEPPQQQYQPEPEPPQQQERHEPEPVREAAPEPQQFADEAPPPAATAADTAGPEESGPPPADEA